MTASVIINIGRAAGQTCAFDVVDLQRSKPQFKNHQESIRVKIYRLRVYLPRAVQAVSPSRRFFLEAPFQV
jgi:hypothetical protein